MRIILLVTLCSHLFIAIPAQTIDDVIQFIFDNQNDCGDPFSDPVWVPALDLCTKGCDIMTQICLEDAELEQKCDDLPKKCVEVLKTEYESGGIKPLNPVKEPDESIESPSITVIPKLGEEDHVHEEEKDHIHDEEGHDIKEGKDYHTWCCKWASEGKCDSIPIVIRPLCQKSCGTIGCRVVCLNSAENAFNCTVLLNIDRKKCPPLGDQNDPTHSIDQPGAFTFEMNGRKELNNEDKSLLPSLLEEGEKEQEAVNKNREMDSIIDDYPKLLGHQTRALTELRKRYLHQ